MAGDLQGARSGQVWEGTSVVYHKVLYSTARYRSTSYHTTSCHIIVYRPMGACCRSWVH